MVTGCWPLVAGCWSLVSAFRIPNSDLCLLPSVFCLLSSAFCLLPSVICNQTTPPGFNLILPAILSMLNTNFNVMIVVCHSREANWVVMAKLRILVFCLSGLDPESSSFSKCYATGCRVKPGMTETIWQLY